jgi:hypothetical protein
MPNPDDRNPVAKFFGLLLIGVGGVITLASGACTITFAAGGIGQTDASGAMNWLLLCLGIGALPMAFGAGLVVIGWLLCRRRVTRRD